MVDPFSTTAAAAQLGGQLYSLVKELRKLYTDFKNAGADFSEFSADLKQISQVIELVDISITNFLNGLGEDDKKRICGTNTVSELVEGTKTKIEKATAMLRECASEKTSKEVKSMKFVLNKSNIQEILQKLKDTALYSMTIMLTILMNAMSEKLTSKVENILSSENFRERLHIITSDIVNHSTQQLEATLDSSAVTEGLNPRTEGGEASRTPTILGPSSASIRSAATMDTTRKLSGVRSFIGKASEKVLKLGPMKPNASKDPPSLALHDAASIRSPSPTLPSIVESASSATIGDCLSDQLPDSGNPIITPASVSASEVPQSGLPVATDEAIRLPASNDLESKHAIVLGEQPLETQESASVQILSSHAHVGTVEKSNPEEIDYSGSNPATSPSRPKPNPEMQSGDAETRKLAEVTSQEDNLPRPRDLVDAFEGIYGPQGGLTGHLHPQFEKPCFSAGTRMGICATEEAEWGFLFFQRPDNWIQLVLIPKDVSRKVILLQPLVEAAEDSSIWCIVEETSNTAIKLFFQSRDAQQQLHVREGRINFDSTGEVSWSVVELVVPKGNSVTRVRDLQYRKCRQGCLHLICDNSNGKLVVLRQEGNEDWLSVQADCEIAVTQEDVVYSSNAISYPELRFRALNQRSIALYSFNGIEYFHDLSTAGDMEKEMQDMDWGEISPDSDSFSCGLIRCIKSVDGVLYRTADSYIYLRSGNPWHYEGDEENHSILEPKRICTVKAGSRFIFSNDWRELFYLSTENELMRIKFEINDSGEITFGDSCSVFGDKWLTTTLEDLSLRPLEAYFPRCQNMADHSESETSTSISSAHSSPSSDRRTKESRNSSTGPGIARDHESEDLASISDISLRSSLDLRRSRDSASPELTDGPAPEDSIYAAGSF